MKFLKEIIPYIIIVVVVLFIRTFIITPVQVDGDSMYPTLNNNQILILKKYDKSYERFDIIVFDYNDSKLVKRIIGLPGETISYQDNVLYINGQEFSDVELPDITTNFSHDTIPEGHYFVMGDNRDESLDSRRIGVISKEDILGTTSFSIFPFNKFGFVD